MAPVQDYLNVLHWSVSKLLVEVDKEALIPMAATPSGEQQNPNGDRGGHLGN